VVDGTGQQVMEVDGLEEWSWCLGATVGVVVDDGGDGNDDGGRSEEFG